VSSYIDHYAAPSYITGRTASRDVLVSWDDLTHRRLCWLYGPNYQSERAAQTAADLAAWNALGSGRPAA